MIDLFPFLGNDFSNPVKRIPQTPLAKQLNQDTLEYIGNGTSINLDTTQNSLTLTDEDIKNMGP